MNLQKDLEVKVDEVLHTGTVEQARRLMSARSGLWVVSAVSLVESATPLPIVTDPFIIAAILADRANTTKLIVATTITSVIGGVIAYLTFFLFFDTVMQWMTPTLLDQFNALTEKIDGGSYKSTFILTILGAVTPIPYTITAWVVGAFKGSLLVFTITSVLGRGIRYVIVGYSTYHFGQLAVDYARRYIGLASVGLVILITVFLWLKM